MRQKEERDEEVFLWGTLESHIVWSLNSIIGALGFIVDVIVYGARTGGELKLEANRNSNESKFITVDGWLRYIIRNGLRANLLSLEKLEE